MLSLNIKMILIVFEIENNCIILRQYSKWKKLGMGCNYRPMKVTSQKKSYTIDKTLPLSGLPKIVKDKLWDLQCTKVASGLTSSIRLASPLTYARHV